MLQRSEALRRHVTNGNVVLGVNHPMRDPELDSTMKLDLVIATRSSAPSRAHIRTTLADLAIRWSIRLSEKQQQTLADLPQFAAGPAEVVLVSLEAKACMTAHIKALPRLHSELTSSHAITHANTDSTLAVGLTIVNAASTFVSPDLNKFNLQEHAPDVSPLSQPHWTERVVEKLEKLPRKTRPSAKGFDAFGIVVVDMHNDGSPVSIVKQHPAPQPGDMCHYDQMVTQLAHAYRVSFGHIA
ncbi:MAG: hypothetical protein ACRC20_03750 [Segniliparus sp.]|uniref:hypothetical protein n=1 Tax=Segniliparus sp. TaxID=2804064 RepID=UPI003F34A441